MPVSETPTRWAEEQTEVLLSISFISEFVFRSPQNFEGPRNTQREVADLLIDHMGRGRRIFPTRAQQWNVPILFPQKWSGSRKLRSKLLK